MNDIYLLDYTKTESLNESEFGLRGKKQQRKGESIRVPSRCRMAMNQAVRKHLTPREELGRRKQKSFPLIPHHPHAQTTGK